MRLTLAIAVAVAILVATAGCGTTFTASKSVDVDLRPTAPGSLVVRVDGKAACSVKAPGPIGIPVICPEGTTPWYSHVAPYVVTCATTPCPPGAIVTYNPGGVVRCSNGDPR